MAQSTYVQLHFIDGPLQGTIKAVLKEEILSNRYYRHYAPVPFAIEQKSLHDTQEVLVKCRIADYLPFSLPPSYGTERFAMCLENAGLGR